MLIRNKLPTINPFKSQAQRKYMYANMPEMAKRWESVTPKGKKLPKKVKKVSNAIKVHSKRNPLQLDPSRTNFIRKAFEKTLRSQFARLKLAIVKKVVEENCFDIVEQIRNMSPNQSPILDSPLTMDWEMRKNLLERKIGKNKVHNALSSPEQLAKFQEWLVHKSKLYILGMTQEQLWKAYIKHGYEKGAGRAFEDTKKHKWSSGEGTFSEESKQQFLRSSFAQPETIEKVQLLASRSFTDLANVDSDMSTKITRVLVDGLIQGDNPRQIARDMIEEVDISLQRACVIARTEIIRAHAEGQLDVMEDMGVEEVGVAVEWSTAGITCQELSPKLRKITSCVCDMCAPLQGIVLKISEAHGLLPRHPNCRCAFIPAGVGEDNSDQINAAEEIREALRQSTEAGYDEDWDKNIEIDDDRPKSLLTNTLLKLNQLGKLTYPLFAGLMREAMLKSKLVQNQITQNDLFKLWNRITKSKLNNGLLSNMFCPTGPGGGVDPTCGKGGLPQDKMPTEPSFISKQATLTEANKTAIKEMQDLASKGDIAGLKVHPGTPSPKVQTYKQDLLNAVGDHLKSEAAKLGVIPEPVTIPKQNPIAPNVPESKLPPTPSYVHPDNIKIAAELKELAVKGDVGSLSLYPGLSGSKEQYKNALIDAVKAYHQEQLGNTSPISPPTASKPIPNPSHEPLPNPATLTHISDLPGSTHPKLMADPNGNKWVVKENPSNEGHIRNEAETDAVYRAAGVLVPKSGIVETSNGPVKMSEYLQGSSSLKEWMVGKSKTEIAEMYQKLGKSAALDALLANWDVIGLNKDNVMIHNGEPYRIDNGGGMKYRAQGGLKKSEDWGGTVKDFQNLLNPSKNQNTAEVFSHLTANDMHKQMVDLLGKKTEILNAVKDSENHSVLSKRFDYMEQLVNKFAPTPIIPPIPKVVPAPKPIIPITPVVASPSPVVASPSTGTPVALHTGQHLADYLKSVLPGKISDLHLAKIAFANPDGIHGKVIKIVPSANYTAGTAAKHAALQNQIVDLLKPILPAGKPISTPKASINAKAKGITKTYGELGTFTGTAAAAASPAHTSSTSTVPSHTVLTGAVTTKGLAEPKFHAYLPEVKDNSVLVLPSSPSYNEAAHLAWKAGLTNEQTSAIGMWKNSAQDIRHSVTDNASAGTPLTSTAKNFVDAITKSPPHEGVLYRGVHGAYALTLGEDIEKKVGIGGTWTDTAPHCMSMNVATGTKFADGKLLFRIVSKTGRPIHKVHNFDHEQEITGMAKTVYRVTNIAKNVEVTNKYKPAPKHVAYLIDLVEE